MHGHLNSKPYIAVLDISCCDGILCVSIAIQLLSTVQ